MRVLSLALLIAACASSPEPAHAPSAATARAPALDLAPAPPIALEPPPAPAPACPEDMSEGPPSSSFCIDHYEAPNVAGAVPLAFQTAEDGEAWCAARGKRLCTETEWQRACEGASARRYPYGDAHEPSRCNDDKQWLEPKWTALQEYPRPASLKEAARLLQADRSGARDRCVSEAGVYDLTGNVAEWTRRTTTPGAYSHILKGCFWAGCKRQRYPSCDYRNFAHPGGFRTYEAGFRCCRSIP